MANAGEFFTRWLRDAYAMEEQAETVLAALSDRLVRHPEVKARVDRHLEETRQQASRLRECIERRRDDVSGLKTWLAYL